MKKLMIAVAIVCAAAFAQAANFNWDSAAALHDGSEDSDWEFTGMAYLIKVTDPLTFAVADDLTITGGEIINSTVAKDSAIGGAFDGTAYFTDGQQYKFAILVTEKGTPDAMATSGLYGVDLSEGGEFYTATWSTDTGASIFNVDGDYYATVDKTISSVPEPTSGLLLLLGVAGLALKRRRA